MNYIKQNLNCIKNLLSKSQMTSKDARELTDRILVDKITGEVEEILSGIKESSKNGNYFFDCGNLKNSDKISKQTLDYFKDLGYIVEKYNSRYYLNGYMIRWDKEV